MVELAPTILFLFLLFFSFPRHPAYLVRPFPTGNRSQDWQYVARVGPPL